MSLSVTLKCDKDRLNLMSPHYHSFTRMQIRKAIFQGVTVEWEREGEVRVLPNAVLRDAIREYEMHNPTNSIDPNKHVKRISQELAGWVYWEQTIPVSPRV